MGKPGSAKLAMPTRMEEASTGMLARAGFDQSLEMTQVRIGYGRAEFVFVAIMVDHSFITPVAIHSW
jgi:hypothetical protein